LAISKQLAEHLGADLELRESTSAGCVFALALPLSRVSDTAKSAAG
jgi:signal transduction histidine kinase